ncbi:hypothetical protein SAMN05421636_103180 [Pricia antarctica]|uniref:Uncharacterized protein n=1 Tax=Pricia antarctica TaxID=641691 RepID=A0A1G7A0K4_9FLAO|nr:hypothetical protein SAMN05421636_103180 [Pricia antarctica]
MYTRAIYYFGFMASSLPFAGVKIINRSYTRLENFALAKKRINFLN